MNSRTALKLVAALLLVVGALYALERTGVNLTCTLAKIESVRDAGPVGLAVFVGTYAVATWAMLPASWLQGAAGFLYGAGPGIALAWLASTGFGLLAFEATRGRLRGPFTRFLRRRGGRGLDALQRTVEERGLVAVLLLRISPLAPYNVVSYLLGLSGMDRTTYLIGSGLGGLVPVLVYAILGSAVSDLASLTDAGKGSPVASAVVIGTTLVASLGVAWLARRALAEQPA